MSFQAPVSPSPCHPPARRKKLLKWDYPLVGIPVTWRSSCLHLKKRELPHCRFFCLFVWLHSVWDLSSPARDRTCVPCIERWILNHWATRKVLVLPIRKTVTVRAIRISKKVRPVRSVGLVVHSYPGRPVWFRFGTACAQGRIPLPSHSILAPSQSLMSLGGVTVWKVDM